MNRIFKICLLPLIYPVKSPNKAKCLKYGKVVEKPEDFSTTALGGKPQSLFELCSIKYIEYLGIWGVVRYKIKQFDAETQKYYGKGNNGITVVKL